MKSLRFRTTLALLALCLPAAADVFSQVPEAAGYQVVYELDIPLNGGFQGSTPVPYATNLSANWADGSFDRVGYYLELTGPSGTRWCFTSMDAFTPKASRIGLPHPSTDTLGFAQSVGNLLVRSNVAGVVNGSFDQGQVEIWPGNYFQANANGVFAADNATYDWGDQRDQTIPGYGSFQIHNPAQRQTVLAYNHWGSGAGSGSADPDDVGIGNNPTGNPDWTFAGNAGSYTARRLVVLARPKTHQVALTEYPANGKIVPRDPATNLATAAVTGTESAGGYEAAVLRILRNGEAYGEDRVSALTYAGGVAAFSFTPTIQAELARYTFQLYLKKGDELALVRESTDVAGGDVLLWYGQSNAEAMQYEGSANGYASPWIRSFGVSSDQAALTTNYSFWVQGDGNGSQDRWAGVGQWAMVVARKIVDTEGIPVAVLNGARQGYSMPRLQKDDANPDELNDSNGVYRTYNRLRYRAKRAGVAEKIRAIFFYQGESDYEDTATHVEGFAGLMQDWAVDYPGVEQIFVCQLHVGCQSNRNVTGLRDAQRILPDIYPQVRIMATNGLRLHTDDCHYPFTGGYETLGLNVFRQVARDLYGKPDAADINPPNPAKVVIANAAEDRLLIQLRDPGATITVENGALEDFRLNGSAAVLTSCQVTAAGILLQYDRPVTGATSLEYLAHAGSAGGWIRNANGVGMVTFSEAVRDDKPVVTITQPLGTTEVPVNAAMPLAATAVADSGAVVRMEIRIDGILHTAVAGNAITTSWTPTAEGRHKVAFTAIDDAGRRREQTLVVFAGTASAPAGIGGGLKVWLRPEKGITRDSAGRVTRWSDSSGNGNDGVQTNAAACPVYRERAFDAMPGVVFDGNDSLSCATGMPVGSYTKVVKVNFTTLTGTNVLSSANSATIAHALFTANTPYPQLWHNGIGFASSTTPVVTGRSYVVTGTYDGTTRQGRMYLDGVLTATGTGPYNTNDPSWQVGSFANSNYLQGAVSEVMIYDRALTAQEQSTLKDYLSTKGTLPEDAAGTFYSSWADQNLASGDRTAAGDANGDGIPNLIEFALGLGTATDRLPRFQTTGNGIVYRRPTDRAGVMYEMQQSADLQTWQKIDDIPGNAAAGVEERIVTLPAHLPPGAGFYRLVVSEAP